MVYECILCILMLIIVGDWLLTNDHFKYIYIYTFSLQTMINNVLFCIISVE